MAADKPSTVAAAALAAVLLLALVAASATASELTVWERPRCTGARWRITACGCSDLFQRAGYQFVYTGQSAALYNQPGCSGEVHTLLRASASMCSPIGWMSVFIQC